MSPVTGTPIPSGASSGTLAEARKRFILQSKRYDLIDSGDLSTNVDNGANYYINRGQWLLDLMSSRFNEDRRHQVSVAADTWFLEVPYLISVSELFVINSEGRTRITKGKMPLGDFRQVHYKPVAEWDSGTPKYWSANTIQLSPSLLSATSGTFSTDGVLEYDDVQFTEDYTKSGLMWYPKTDVQLTIELYGRFLSPELANSDDVSYWTRMWPDLLSNAACLVLEAELRSRENVTFLMELISQQLNQLDDMKIENELTGLTFIMEG